MWFRRNKEIRFSGRRHTKLGILSMVMGIVVIIGFLTISMLSGLAGGKGGLVLGMIGILLFFMSIAGLTVSYKAFKKKDIFYVFPIAGAVINGIMLVVLFTLYLLGI